MDRDHKGYLDRKDLIVQLKNLGEQWEPSELDNIFLNIDSKEGSQITYEQFKVIMHNPQSMH